MEKLKSYVSLNKLLAATKRLAVLLDEGYVQMTASQSSDALRRFDEIEEAVQEISSLRKLEAVYVMVNTMPPNQEIPWHQDWLEPTPLQPYKGPLIERWHLPIRTNSWVVWFDRDHPDGFNMPQGYWCGPVPYWNKHKVENLGREERVHLIVDLDCPEPMGIYE
jgi:hypothetical protein